MWDALIHFVCYDIGLLITESRILNGTEIWITNIYAATRPFLDDSRDDDQ